MTFTNLTENTRFFNMNDKEKAVLEKAINNEINRLVAFGPDYDFREEIDTLKFLYYSLTEKEPLSDDELAVYDNLPSPGPLATIMNTYDAVIMGRQKYIRLLRNEI